MSSDSGGFCFWVKTAALFAAALPGFARADVDVTLVPEQPAALVGDVVRLKLMLTADSPQLEAIASARVILNWDPAELQLMPHDNTGAVSVMTRGFPSDPSGLNESTVPQDGTALFVAFAPLGSPIEIDQEGVLLGTIVFECLAPSEAHVSVGTAGGTPETYTSIFDGNEPNLDITGLISGALLPIFEEPARLVLDVQPHAPVGAGDSVTVTLAMENLHGQPAAGFQAFLEFDPAELQFIAGSYSADPFGAALISPIAATNGQIDLAAGIDVLAGQPASSADATLVTLAFTAARNGCLSSVGFRAAAEAESRISDDAGAPILPLALVDPEPLDPALCECPCDLDGTPGIDVFDLLAYLDLWFAADAGAEWTNDDPPNVDVFDLLSYLDCWFAPPAACP